MADMQMVFSIIGDASSLITASGESEAALGRLEATGTRAGSAVSNAFGAAAIAGIAALGAGLASTITTAASFEKQISAISAVAGAGTTSIEALRAKALELGRDTSFSASEAAAGMEEMVKAGLSIADVMNGGARAALDLAAAGGLSVAEAATVASNAMNAFGLSGDKMAHIADALAGASVASATDVHQLGYAMASVGAVANTVGLSFDDTTTAISLLAQAGLKGSDSGTSLKTMLLNLNPSSKAAAAEMRTLGIITADGSNKFFDATGNVKSMADVAQVLQDSMSGLTKEQQINALQTAFGTDAIRAAAIMAKAGAAGFNEMTAAEAAAGGAQKIANERLNNFLGSMEKLRGSVETASIMIGSLFLPALKDIADQLTDVVNNALPMIEALPDAWRTVGQVFENDWSPDESLGPFINAVGNAALGVKGLVDVVVGLPEPVKAAGLAFAAVMVAAGPLSTVLGLLPELFGLMLAPVTALLSPLGLLAAGVAALAYAWTSNLGDIQGKTAEFMGIVGPAFQGLGGIISTAVSGDIAGAFGQFMTLVTTTGQQLAPLLAAWGAEFTAWVPGAITSLEATLTAQVAAIPWGAIWSAATTAATTLATFLGTLVVDFSVWLTAQVALIPWATVWTAAKTATTALATFLGTQVVDFATWLTAQAAKIPWATVWTGIKDAATALSTFVATQAVDFATWLGAQAAAIPWGTVWTSAKDTGTALSAFLVTQVVDFATWLGAQVAAIPWASVWGNVTGLDTSMQATFVTAGGTMDWGAVITSNAQMAADMSKALGTKISEAITGTDWTTVGEGLGKGIVDAIGIAFGLAQVSDAWATGFGAAIVRAVPAMNKALVQVLAGVFMGALAEAWNLAIASWVPGVGTVTPPTPGSGGWGYTPPGGRIAPILPPMTQAPATGTYVPPSQIPQGPDYGPQQPQGPIYGPAVPPGFTPGALTPTPPAVQTPSTGQYPPIDNSSRASFARTAWPIFLDAAHGDANLAQMMIAAAISENGTVGSGSDIGAGNNFYGIKAPGPSTATGSFTSSTWEQGQGTINDSFASFPDSVTGANGFMQFLQENPRYAPALAAYQKSGDADQLFQDVNAAGYATNPNWGSTISNIRRNQVAPNVPTAMPQGQPPAAVTVPQVNQFSPAFGGTLSPAEAKAACGPAALAWFMTEYGQTPTPQQALDLAKSAGWSPDKGMYGPGAFSNALTSAGIPNTLDTNPAPSDIAAAAASGQPFALSTRDHYYQVQGGDLSGLNVGGSGVAGGGSSVMSLDQITRLSGAVNGLITVTQQVPTVADAAGSSVATMGQQSAATTPELAGIGTALDPVVASMDQGAVSVGGLTDAIIASAAQQGVATQSADDYSAGLTSQQTALEGVLAGFSATTPAAADLLTQLQAGAISSDDAAVAFAGLATTTATATGAIGDATGTMSSKVITDFGTMADGSTVAADGMGTSVGTAVDTMATDVTTSTGTMAADASTSAVGMQTDVGAAVDGMVGAVVTLADGMQTSVSTSADTMDTNASTSAATMQGAVGDAVDGMVGAVVTLADGMNTSVSGSADAMNTDTSGSALDMSGSVGDAVSGMVDAVVTLADGMNTSVAGSADTMNTDTSGSADDMATNVGGAFDSLSTPIADTATGFGAVGTAAHTATPLVTGLGSAAGTATPPIENLGQATGEVQPIDMGDSAKQIAEVGKAADKTAKSLDTLAKAGGNHSLISSGGSSNDGSGHGGSKGGGGKAAGGSVDPNVTYIVGENGPEVFVPATAGTIIPNHRLRFMANGGVVGTLPDGGGMYGVAPLVSLSDADRTILQGISDRADQLILKGSDLATALGTLGDKVTSALGTGDGKIIAAIQENGKVEATGVSLLQGLATALTRTVSAPSTHTTAPAAVTAPQGAASAATPGGMPTAPLPPGYEYKQYSPGVWGVQAKTSDLAVSAPPAAPAAPSGGVPGRGYDGAFGPGTSGPAPGTGGPVASPGYSGAFGPGTSGTAPGPVAAPGNSGAFGPGTSGTAPSPALPPGTGPVAAPGNSGAFGTGTSGAAPAGITAPLAAAATSAKTLSATVTASATTMRIAAATQATNMASSVGKSSDTMRNDVGTDVTVMTKNTTDDIGTMADTTTKSASDMETNVSGSADTMKTLTVTAADLMKQGAVTAAGLMSDGVVAATDTMHDGAVGSNGWITKLKVQGVDLASDMNLGVTGAASALSDNLNKAPNGAIFDMYSRGIGHVDALRSESIDLIGGNPKGSVGMVRGMVAAMSGLNDGLNGSKGQIYLTYSDGVTHIDKLRDQGISLMNRAAFGDDGHSGMIGSFRSIKQAASGDDGKGGSVQGFTDVLGASSTLENHTPNVKKWTDAADAIKKAYNDAANAIKNLPDPGGSSGKSSISSLSLSTDSTPAGAAIDYDRLATALKAAMSGVDATHPINFSLTVEPKTQEYEIVSAEAGSAT